MRGVLLRRGSIVVPLDQGAGQERIAHGDSACTGATDKRYVGQHQRRVMHGQTPQTCANRSQAVRFKQNVQGESQGKSVQRD